jgi:RNase H
VCQKVYLAGISNKHFYIMSDSRAALRALKAHTFSSKLVAECLEILKRLTRRCLVTSMWVPSGHTGIEGNEIVDQLANKGSEPIFLARNHSSGSMAPNTRESQRDGWKKGKVIILNSCLKIHYPGGSLITRGKGLKCS